jgi:hypothetical protein
MIQDKSGLPDNPTTHHSNLPYASSFTELITTAVTGTSS